MKNNKKRGYTILEVLLSVAIIAIISGISIPILQSFQNKNNLSVASEVLANTIRRAEFFSQEVKEDSRWGVKIESGNIILFKGDSFSGRDSNYDENFEISSTIQISGKTEFVFERFSGEPLATGETILTEINGASQILSINEKGTVNY